MAARRGFSSCYKADVRTPYAKAAKGDTVPTANFTRDNFLHSVGEELSISSRSTKMAISFLMEIKEKKMVLLPPVIWAM